MDVAACDTPYSTLTSNWWMELEEFLKSLLDTKRSKKATIGLSVAAMAMTAYFLMKSKKGSEPTSYPELPNAHWLSGHTKQYKSTKSFGKLLRDLNRTLNSPSSAYFRSYFGNGRLVVYNLHELRELFFTNGQKSVGRNLGIRLHTGYKAKDGIIDIHGPVWKNNRRIFLNHLRSVGRERQLSLVLDESKHLTETLEKFSEDFEPGDLLQSAVCNIISTLIFGSRFEYFDPDAERIFNSILTFNSKFDLLPYPIFWLCNYIPLIPSVKERMEALTTTKKFIEHKIEERIRIGIRDPPETLLEAYALELGKGGWKFDVTNLIAVIYELFFAGTETTSTTLNWVLACLTAFPEVQERVNRELESVVGQSELTFSHLRDHLPYTTAVQYEIQRFGCIAANTIPHRMLEDITFESGKVIKKGELAVGALYTIMRDPQYFKYPNDFNPDNFLDENGEVQTNEAFVPYGIGPRVCLGQILADLEVKVFLIEIVRKFKITSNDKIDLDNTVQKITCSPAPFKYNFELRH